MMTFRPTHDVGPRTQCISGLNHAAYGLPVNASRPGSPQAHASLGSGWRPTLAGWDWIPTGFRTRFRRSHHGILSPLTGLSRHTRWCTDPAPSVSHDRPPGHRGDSGRGRRGWRKLHLGVDGSRVIVACALTEPTADDAITGISLVDEVDGHLTRVTADPAYDTLAFYGAAGARGTRVVVPPTKTASLSRRGARSGARDRTIRRVKVPWCTIRDLGQ